MNSECSTLLKFTFFITLLFSFNVNSVFFKTTSLYRSCKLSILYLGFVSLNISVILYNLYEQLFVSVFENVFFKYRNRLIETFDLFSFVCVINYCKRNLRISLN